MINLKEKYTNLKLSNLTEKDIVYICRDALNKEEDKSLYEDEILSLIKYKKWNLKYKDIDGNILLTYPIFNNSIKIVKFLLKKIYDSKVFNEDMSSAFSSCINIKPKSDEMLDFLVKMNINQRYIDNMLFQSYLLYSRVTPNNTKFFLNKADKLMPSSDFEFVSNKLFKNEGLVEAFSHYIFNHEMVIEKKIEILEELISKEVNSVSKKNNSFVEKQKEFDRLKLFVKLEFGLSLVNIKKEKKLNKI
jgi:hypothetical protein